MSSKVYALFGKFEEQTDHFCVDLDAEYADVVKSYEHNFVGGIDMQGWNRVRCYRCENEIGKEDAKASLGFNGVTLGYNCYKCGMRGILPKSWVDRLVSRVGARLEVERKLISKDPEQLPSCVRPVFGPEGVISWASRYLTLPRVNRPFGVPARGLSMQTCIEAGVLAVGCEPPDDWLKLIRRVIFPCGLVDHNTNYLHGWVARSVGKNSVPYLNGKNMHRSALFNHAAILVDTDVPLVVTEGVIDALRFWPHGVAILGKPSDATLESLKVARRPVLLMLDRDARDAEEDFYVRLLLNVHKSTAVRKFGLQDEKDPDLFAYRVLREKAVSEETIRALYEESV